MINELSIDEKRELLKLSKLRMSLDTKIPREKAIDALVEKGIYGNSLDQPSAIDEINKTIGLLGSIKGIREVEIRASLDRLLVEHIIEMEGRKYKLTPNRIKEIEHDLKESEKKLEIIVSKVFKAIIDTKNRVVLTRIFLDFTSEVFGRFGDQWIKYLCNEATPKDFLKEDDINKIFDKCAQKHGVNKGDRPHIKNQSIKFLENIDDLDFSYYKFVIAQGYYITKIVGLDVTLDLFAQEIFSNSTVYLDSNIVFSSLLSSSRRNFFSILSAKREGVVYNFQPFA